MRINCFALLTGIILLSLSSCTITKRHFNSGYHIEWNKKLKSNSTHDFDEKLELIANKDSISQELSSPTTFNVPMEETEQISPDIELGSDQKEQISSDEIIARVPQVKKETKEKTFPIFKEIKKPMSTKSDQTQVDEFSPWTFALLGIIMIGIASYFLLLSAELLVSIWVIAGIALIGMILGIITMVSLATDGKKYRGEGFTWFLAIYATLPGIGMLIGLIILFLAILTWY